MSAPIVILVNTLAEFEQEVPAPAVVRLNLTESTESGKMLTYLNVNLDLQAVNSESHIVWLNDCYTLEKVPGHDNFWLPAHKVLYQQMPRAQRIIRDYLTARGYEVRGGQYGLPSDIKPIRGGFDCLNWVKDSEDTYRVESASAPPPLGGARGGLEVSS